VSGSNKVIINGRKGVLHGVSQVMGKRIFILRVGRQPVSAVLTGLVTSMSIENAKPGDRHLEASVLSTWIVHDFDTLAGLIIIGSNRTDLYLHGTKVFD
jgi:hypothetical protein